MSWKLFVVVYFLASDGWSSSSTVRQKRVINGEILDGRIHTGYSAPKYFVWIGFRKATPAWDYSDEKCGGGLLTLQIVQTSCRCFVVFQSQGTTKEERPIRDDDSYEVQVGCSKIEDIAAGPGCGKSQIRKYIIHPQCARNFGWVSNDFALLTLERELTLSNTLKPAPVIVLEDMSRMWTRFSAGNAVCMVMGFGRYHGIGSLNFHEKSDVLRHGWQALMSYKECFDQYRKQAGTTSLLQYQDIATWSCMKGVGKIGIGSNSLIVDYLTGLGDSGSPITCGNFYFGLVSQASKSTSDLTIASDLVFYAYANSDLYRDNMTQDMLHYNKRDCHIYHTIPPDTLFNPGTAPPNFLVFGNSMNSGQSRRTITLSNSMHMLVFSCILGNK